MLYRTENWTDEIKFSRKDFKLPRCYSKLSLARSYIMKSQGTNTKDEITKYERDYDFPPGKKKEKASRVIFLSSRDF